jgi:hypothetical protein
VLRRRRVVSRCRPMLRSLCAAMVRRFEGDGAGDMGKSIWCSESGRESMWCPLGVVLLGRSGSLLAWRSANKRARLSAGRGCGVVVGVEKRVASISSWKRGWLKPAYSGDSVGGRPVVCRRRVRGREGRAGMGGCADGEFAKS